MIRFVDVCLSFIGILIFSPILLLLLVLGYFYIGSPLFKQTRVGLSKKPFVLVKYRTMHVNTPSVATHLADASSITSFGRFLRRTKLDELPQLWNVLIGDMSMVGPRPNLFNQTELIECRDKLNIYSVRPGITGLAQINNIDMSTPELLAKYDSEMIKTLSLKKYLGYISATVVGKGQGDRVI